MELTPDLAWITPLFAPADRPDRFAKAAASGADALILDLEDAVAPDAKGRARDALRDMPRSLPVLVRINAADTPWHQDDLAAVEGLPLAALMLPKAGNTHDLARIARRFRVVALVETAAGLAAARDLASSGDAARLAFGSIDYAADLNCAHRSDILLPARAELVLASRLGGLPPPLDGVTVDIDTPDAAADDARQARAMGFGGKLVIHPRQVQPVLEAFAPTVKEIAWAHRVVASADGVVRIDGMMVDEPVRIRARAILAAARSKIGIA